MSRAEAGAAGPRRRRPRAFRPGPWLTACALAGVALLLALGTWQAQRLQWKTALIAERDARLAATPAPLPAAAEVEDWRAWDFRRVTVPEGEFLAERAQRFGVRGERGRVGHDLLVPLRRPDGSALLVNVGFVPADKRPAVVDVETPAEGVLRYRGDDAAPGWMTPANEPDEGLWYWYDMAALRDATGLELLPVVLDATEEPAGVDLPNNHLQYAITWYTLAAALAAIYVALGRARGREEKEER